MPIPFIIGGAAILAGIFGAKKGLDAKENYARAKSVVEEAIEDLAKTNKRLDRQKQRTTNGLERLGEVRLTVEGDLMKRFVASVKQINQVSYRPITLGGVQVHVSAPELHAMELSSYQAADLMKDGVSALSSGVLTGIGAGGLASTIGVASTGTAIGSLTGVAATNATLAWLGGGSLAAGGMGMAGGAAVLGGAIAGPVIAIMGFSAAKKSERALTEAFEHESEIRDAIEQVEGGIMVLSSISDRVDEMQNVIKGVAHRFQEVLKVAEKMLKNKHKLAIQLQEESDKKRAEDASKGILERVWKRLRGNKSNYDFPSPFDFNNFSDQDKSTYTMLTGFGYALYALLKVQVLDETGALTSESESAISDGNNILEAA